MVFVKDEPVDEDDLLPLPTAAGSRQEQSEQQQPQQQSAEDLGEIKLEDDGGAAAGDVKPELKVTCESARQLQGGGLLRTFVARKSFVRSDPTLRSQIRAIGFSGGLWSSCEPRKENPVPIPVSRPHKPINIP